MQCMKCIQLRPRTVDDFNNANRAQNLLQPPQQTSFTTSTDFDIKNLPRIIRIRPLTDEEASLSPHASG
jgi:hypothetical protein